jgi:hypothetical protein
MQNAGRRSQRSVLYPFPCVRILDNSKLHLALAGLVHKRGRALFRLDLLFRAALLFLLLDRLVLGFRVGMDVLVDVHVLLGTGFLGTARSTRLVGGARELIVLMMMLRHGECALLLRL